MNNKLLLSAAITAAVFAGCASDEPNNGGGNNGKECGYVAVNIVQPKLSRAEGDGYENGTAAENEAKAATFFIFDASNSLVSVQTVGLTNAEVKNGNDNPQVEKVYGAVLVIDGIETNKKYAGKMYCVLNAPSDIKNLSLSTTETDLKAKVADYCTSYQSEGQFIMTSSAYKDAENAEMCAVSFTDDNYKDSSAEALKAPLDIYVERVVAKVNATEQAGGMTNEGATPIAGNKLTIKVTGISIANVANTAYLFKSLGNTHTIWPSWSDVNDAANFRSYWEDAPADLTYTNKTYNTISGNTSAPADNNYTALTNPAIDGQYILPNTSDTKTCVLVTAQLMDGDNPADLVWVKGGYFTNDDAKDLLCQSLATAQFAIKSTDASGNTIYRQLAKDNLVWSQKQKVSGTPGTADIADLKAYQAVAQINVSEGESVVKYDFVSKSEIHKSEGVSYDIYDACAFLADQKFFAEVFVNGLCYYYVNIDQTPVTADTNPAKFEGVVRNHIYDLSLTGIKGIGTAVFDPDKVIIPDTPKHDQFSYLAARINVLKWRVVKQNISFEGN